jgi:hypothetical protein
MLKGLKNVDIEPFRRFIELEITKNTEGPKQPIPVDIDMINWVAKIEREHEQGIGYSVLEIIEILQGNFILINKDK